MTHAPIRLLALLLLAAPVAAAAQGAPPGPKAGPGERVLDRVVATIGDEAITLHEVEKRAATGRNPMADAVAGPDAGKETSGFQAALDDLIGERLILAEAKKLEVDVQEADIDKHVKSILEQNGWSEADFDTAVKMLGFPGVKAYREHARRELLKSQVLRLKVGAKVRVTDREVQEEFDRQFDGGKSEEEVHLWHIVFRIPDAVTVDQIHALLAKAEQVRAKAVAKEKPFEELAKEYGEDGSATKGGDVGWFARGRLQPSLEEAAFGLKDGEVSQVVQSSAGFHILRVTERRRVPLRDAEEAKARVRYELSEAAFRKLFKDYIRELRASSHVEIKGP